MHRPPPPSSAGLLPSAGLPSGSYPVDHRQHAPLARGAPPSYPAQPPPYPGPPQHYPPSPPEYSAKPPAYNPSAP